ncbi:hypothetical protein ACVIJW_005438 [Bradyrhizobium barranii subsp. barranii]
MTRGGNDRLKRGSGSPVKVDVGIVLQRLWEDVIVSAGRIDGQKRVLCRTICPSNIRTIAFLFAIFLKFSLFFLFHGPRPSYSTQS